MAGSSNIRAGRAYVELGTQGSIEKGLSAAEAQLKSFGKATLAIGAGMAASGISVLDTLTSMAVAFAHTGEEVERASQRTSMSATAFQELSYAAKQTGADAESLESGIKKMQKAIGEAAQGSPEAAKALRSVGLSIADLKGLSPDQQFGKIADGLSRISDPAQRVRAAMDIFGKGGTQLLPMLEQGSAGIEKMRKHAEELGIVMSDQDAAAATTFADTLQDLEGQSQGVMNQIGAAATTVLEPFAKAVSHVLSNVIDWIKNNRQIVVTIMEVAAGVTVAGTAIAVLGAGIIAVGAVFGGMASIIGVVGTVIGAVISPVALLTAGVGALAAYLIYSSGAASSMEKGITKAIATVVSFLDPALGSWAGFTASMAKLGHNALYELQSGWITLKGYLSSVWEWMKATFPGVVYGWGGAVAQAAVKIIQVFDDTVAYVKNLWGSLIDWISDSMARSMVSQDITATIKQKYDGKTLTGQDAKDLAAPEMQNANAAITKKAEADATAKGLSGKAFSDAVSDQAQPAIAAADKAILAKYKAEYEGKKLDDQQLAALIEQQTDQSLAYMKQMRDKEAAARDAAMNDQLNANGQAAKDRIAGIQDWANKGAGETSADHARDADKEKADLAKEQADLDKKHADQLAKDNATLAGMPRLSDTIKKLYQGVANAAGVKSPDAPSSAAQADAAAAVASAAKARGTFNSSALQSLQGNSNNHAAQTAKNTAMTAAAAKKTADGVQSLVDQGPTAFV